MSGKGRNASGAGGGSGPRLSKEEEQEFKEIFNLVDNDGSGAITRDEMPQRPLD